MFVERYVFGLSEADTCRLYVTPKLQAAGWDQEPYLLREQVTFTDGRISWSAAAPGAARASGPTISCAIARISRSPWSRRKRTTRSPGDGLQQAKDYAEILGLKFAYATNGNGIVEFDYLTGAEREIVDFPAPEELWQRLKASEGLTEPAAEHLLARPTTSRTARPATTRRSPSTAPSRRSSKASGASCSRWRPAPARRSSPSRSAGSCPRPLEPDGRATGEPRILYLADRNILVDDPKDKTFAPFGDARHKIEGGEVVKSREMYFAIYQAIARTKRRPGLYREYAPDFFDLIIVDECHRGSARDESNWREILEYFEPAYQLGMTATPLREDNRDTYLYFGNPIYTYSLRQGIDDGFLAPYRVHRVDHRRGTPPAGGRARASSTATAARSPTRSTRPRTSSASSRSGPAPRPSPGTSPTSCRKTDRFAKTIVFCVDQEHADEMRRALNNLNADLVQRVSGLRLPGHLRRGRHRPRPPAAASRTWRRRPRRSSPPRSC